MKYIVSTLILIFLFSCENPSEKSNEQLKTVIFKKGTEIQKNYNEYKTDMENSGLANLLNLDRLKLDKEHVESKIIIIRTEEIFSKFNVKNQNLVNDLKSLFDSIKPTKRVSQKDILRMKSEYDKSIEITKYNFKTDSSVFTLIKKIIKLLDEDCKYEIIDNQIRFYTQNCINDYNFYNSNLESAIMLVKFDASKKKFDKLKEKMNN